VFAGISESIVGTMPFSLPDSGKQKKDKNAVIKASLGFNLKIVFEVINAKQQPELTISDIIKQEMNNIFLTIYQTHLVHKEDSQDAATQHFLVLWNNL
jgi:hypothetical protein